MRAPRCLGVGLQPTGLTRGRDRDQGLGGDFQQQVIDDRSVVIGDVGERPRSATETATPMEALEIIRRMAVRYGDDQIASVLNRRGYPTGKGMRWNQTRVATARRNHSIAGQKRALPDPETVSLSQAARICGISHRTIERLVEAGLLRCEQVTPRAPWEIRRSDLDAEPIRKIIDRLQRTGKLVLQGGCAEDQLALFTENQGDDNARHHE